MLIFVFHNIFVMLNPPHFHKWVYIKVTPFYERLRIPFQIEKDQTGSVIKKLGGQENSFLCHKVNRASRLLLQVSTYHCLSIHEVLF